MNFRPVNISKGEVGRDTYIGDGPARFYAFQAGPKEVAKIYLGESQRPADALRMGDLAEVVTRLSEPGAVMQAMVILFDRENDYFMRLPETPEEPAMVGSVSPHGIERGLMVPRCAALYAAELKSWQEHIFPNSRPVASLQQGLETYVRDVINTGTPLAKAGIAKSLIQQLNRNNICSIEQLEATPDSNLMEIRQVGKTTVGRIRRQVNQYRAK